MRRALIEALRFLSILPVPNPENPPKWNGKVLAVYPLAGLVMGTVVAGIAWISSGLLSDWSVAVMVTAARIVITGGLHLDGLADFADGLGGGTNAQDRLTIMQDSHIGSFGVLALLVICGLQTVFIAEWLGEDNHSKHLVLTSIIPLAIVPAISRGNIPLLMTLFPNARPNGLGNKMQCHATVKAAIAALLLAGLIATVCFSISGLILWGCTSVLMVTVGHSISKPLGGLTGDCYGALIEIGDTLGFLGILILHEFFPAIP